jgi:RimJ/RimL family protein N-acetyltransferase
MPFPTIDPIPTPRLAIRPVHERDLTDLYEINGDPQVTHFLPYKTWTSLEDGVSWLGRMAALAAGDTGQQFVLELNESRKVIGTLLLFRFDEPNGRAELGYVLGRRYWSQGLMREALQGFCAYVFGVVGLRRMEAEVNPTNVSSNALLARVGFTKEGTLRQRWVTKGVPYDTNIYGMLADEWHSRRARGGL